MTSVDDAKPDVGRLCDFILAPRRINLTTLKLAAKLGLKERVKTGVEEALRHRRGVEDIAGLLRNLFVSRNDKAIDSIEKIFENMRKKDLDQAIGIAVEGKHLARLYETKNLPAYVQSRLPVMEEEGEEDDVESRIPVRQLGDALMHGVLGNTHLVVPRGLLPGDDKKRNGKSNTNDDRCQWTKLLLWSLIAERLDLAVLILRKNRGPHPIGAALFCCCILKRMHFLCEAAQSSELRSKELMERCAFFESIAIKILDSCHKTSPYRTKFLLLQRLGEFGQKSALDLAHKGRHLYGQMKIFSELCACAEWDTNNLAVGSI